MNPFYALCAALWALAATMHFLAGNVPLGALNMCLFGMYLSLSLISR